MKVFPIGRSLFVLGLLSLAPQAQAASAFGSDATLTFTLQKVENLDHAGSLSGLSVSGSFQQAGSPDSYAVATGDGAVTANNPSVGPTAVAVGGSFSRTFAVGGSVSDGTVGSSHSGLFGLDFSNAGVDRYQIDVALGYQLHAGVSGDFADSGVVLDYYSGDESFSGTDRADASVFALVSATQVGPAGLVYSFTLAPGGLQSLSGSVVISGNLEASPVPVPAAAWLFASGIAGVFGVARRKA